MLPRIVNSIHSSVYFLIDRLGRALIIFLQKIHPPKVSFHADPANDKKKLVIMFTWLLAKEKHIAKYRQLWFQRGYDVLLVRTDPVNVILPTVYCTSIYNEVYRFLAKPDQCYEKIMLKSFSVGAFQMINFVRVTLENDAAGRSVAFRNLLQGWIFDSAAYPQSVHDKVSRVVLPEGAARLVLKSLLFLWLQVTQSHTLRCYQTIANYGILNPHHIPALFIFSENDELSELSSNYQFINSWSKIEGLVVRQQFWPISAHVGHLKEHPEDYNQAIDAFLVELGSP